MTNLEFVVNEDWKNWYKGNSWAAFVPSNAKNGEVKYIRNSLRENSKIYRVVKEDKNGQELKCSDCGSGIMSATVAHPIHDGPFPLSGSGQCHYEQVPYCPKCEEKPNYNGSFITIPYGS